MLNIKKEYDFHYNNAIFNYNNKLLHFDLFMFHYNQSLYFHQQEIFSNDKMFEINTNYINNNLYNTFNMDFDNNDIDFRESRLHKYLKTKKPKIYKEVDVNAKNIKDLIDIINKNDYDNNYTYNINLEGLHNIKNDLIELNELIGLDKIKNSIFDQLIYFIQQLHKTENKKDSDFKHTVIYGPPGTGKTLIAKILGNIYSKIGILKNNYFHTVSRGDLIAGYLGQTAIKTKKVIQQALGGVLFIDEAYSLGGENSDNYSKECLDTLCHELSEYKDELMVIIAGYENELNKYFFSKNKGLDSRFVWRFEIDSYSYKELMYIFIKKINDIGWKVDEDNKINEEWFKTKMSYFTNYGRDMEILLLKTKIVHSKRVFGKPNLLKKITLEDLNNGFELYKDNSEVKKEIPSFYC
jgi:SpoVK/Ycf46/Vps4 family AAA+-type ATPase